VVGEVERRVLLTLDAQDPALAPARDARPLAPSRKAPQQGLGPEVLVDVDSYGRDRWAL
jgi:hypothetical protein